MTLLSVNNIDVHYGAIQALCGVSLEVGKGEIVTLIGANGAGKSTTLRVISGMIAPSAGSIQFTGEQIQGAASHKLVRMGISHVPEGRGIFANLTAAENLELGAYAPRSRESG